MSIVVDQLENELEDDETAVNLNEETSNDASDDLEADINPEFEIPDKFKDKSMEDVVKSYMEAEKELGRKNNEVGELRKLTDDFLKQKIEPTVTKEPNIDLDDLLEDPNKVITKAMDDNPRIAALEKQLQDALVEKEREGFESKHTDWQDTLNSTDFQSWIQKSAVRQRMFDQANKYDYAMADELFTTYGELRGASKEVAETKAATKRKKALQNTSVERGSTGEVTKKIYKRADLIRLQMTDPSRYRDMDEEIMLAYQEGRVR